MLTLEALEGMFKAGHIVCGSLHEAEQMLVGPGEANLVQCAAVLKVQGSGATAHDPSQSRRRS